ncbi:MAG TPA: cbb3-type cytochrome oxidase assembly protein CcoS [Saprospiraceae bacterium]|nr:cbb3-type cytochrome oxidase assembly protein CcoS [Saprospiraceae bacterium]
MSVIIILLVVSILIAGSFLIAFLWSVKDGQFDDHFSSSQRMLFDDKKSLNKKN